MLLVPLEGCMCRGSEVLKRECYLGGCKHLVRSVSNKVKMAVYGDCLWNPILN